MQNIVRMPTREFVCVSHFLSLERELYICMAFSAKGVIISIRVYVQTCTYAHVLSHTVRTAQPMREARSPWCEVMCVVVVESRGAVQNLNASVCVHGVVGCCLCLWCADGGTLRFIAESGARAQSTERASARDRKSCR